MHGEPVDAFREPGRQDLTLRSSSGLGSPARLGVCRAVFYLLCKGGGSLPAWVSVGG